VTDAVVIGSGPNGLVAANILADQGWEVVVLEAASEPGGAVRSAELVEPGFVNDRFSAFYPLAVASPALAALHLEHYGLSWRRAPLVLAHPAEDGSCPALSTDLDETAASLDRLGPGDGDAWRRLYAGWQRVGSMLLDGLLSPFPPLRSAASLLRRLGPTEAVHLARFCALSVRRMGEEELAGDASRRLLAGCALHADLSPEATLSGLFGWILCCLGQTSGFPVPEGGAGQLTAALTTRLQSRGGQVVCGTTVTEIVVRDGRAVAVRAEGGVEVAAERAVIADVDAPSLYLDLVDPRHLPSHLLDDVRRRFCWDPAVVKVDWTLDGPIPWAAASACRAGTVHVAEGIDSLTLWSAQLSMGLVPDRPFLIVGQQGLADPTRQPEGKQTAWAYTRVPRRIRGDAGGDGLTGSWDASETEVMLNRMEAEIERLAPGFHASLRGRHVLAPPGLEGADRNLRGGSLNGGTAQVHQQGLFRPVPGLGGATTPVPGLFLGSSSAHPGGGVHGACGANAARAAIASDRRRRITRAIGGAVASSNRLLSSLGRRSAGTETPAVTSGDGEAGRRRPDSITPWGSWRRTG
jgi:phytoene dehydrogenase-like protein